MLSINEADRVNSVGCDARVDLSAALVSFGIGASDAVQAHHVVPRRMHVGVAPRPLGKEAGQRVRNRRVVRQVCLGHAACGKGNVCDLR